MEWQDYRISKRLSLNSSIVETVYSILAEIDAIKNSWQITRRLIPQTIKRLTRSVIITSTGSSNRIEGNNLTDMQVENLYKNLHIKKLKTRDEQEIAGYLQCLELIFTHYQDITINESFVLKLHHDMLAHSEKDTYSGPFCLDKILGQERYNSPKISLLNSSYIFIFTLIIYQLRSFIFQSLMHSVAIIKIYIFLNSYFCFFYRR